MSLLFVKIILYYTSGQKIIPKTSKIHQSTLNYIMNQNTFYDWLKVTKSFTFCMLDDPQFLSMNVAGGVNLIWVSLY